VESSCEFRIEPLGSMICWETITCCIQEVHVQKNLISHKALSDTLKRFLYRLQWNLSDISFVSHRFGI
jgi:hypothetical protein